MELVSSISFQTTYPLQSAEVVGKSLMVPILYKPTLNQTKFMAKNMIFAICKSTFPSGSSKGRKVLFIVKMDLRGFISAMLVMEIEKMLRFFPDMYIMNPFMSICFPGLVATDIAFAFFLATSAMAEELLLSVRDPVPPSDSICFSMAFTRRMPIGACRCWRSE